MGHLNQSSTSTSPLTSLTLNDTLPLRPHSFPYPLPSATIPDPNTTPHQLALSSYSPFLSINFPPLPFYAFSLPASHPYVNFRPLLHIYLHLPSSPTYPIYSIHLSIPSTPLLTPSTKLSIVTSSIPFPPPLLPAHLSPPSFVPPPPSPPPFSPRNSQYDARDGPSACRVHRLANILKACNAYKALHRHFCAIKIITTFGEKIRSSKCLQGHWLDPFKLSNIQAKVEN